MGSQQNRKVPGTPNRLNAVTTKNSGSVVIQTPKGPSELVDIRSKAVEETELVEEELLTDEADAAKAEGDEEIVEEEPQEEKEVMEKATGDIKPEDKPGLAKASPAFEEVEPSAKASVEEEEAAIEENSSPAKDDDTEE